MIHSVRIARFSTEVNATSTHELLVEQLASGLRGLVAALVRKIDVRPAREKVLQVPDALAVADQNQFSGCRAHLIASDARVSVWP